MKTLWNDAKTIFHLATPWRGNDGSQEKLEKFYQNQADYYDDFRKRLLHGRTELYSQIPIPQNGVWIDLGGGTGANFEAIQEPSALKEMLVVDLCDPLLEVARKRFRRLGWSQARAIHHDASTYRHRVKADVVTLSYSLTMSKDWKKVVDNAFKLLKPGGVLGVVDFFISRKAAEEDEPQHSRFQRMFWPRWFSIDGVRLNPEHLEHLKGRFITNQVHYGEGRVPYLLGMRAPYYWWLGRKT